MISNFTDKLRKDFNRPNMVRGKNRKIDNLGMNGQPSSKISKSLSSHPLQKNQKRPKQTLQKYYNDSPSKDYSK